MMKKLLIISSRFPYPLEKGDKLRLYHQIRILSKSFKVFLFAISEDDLSQDSKDELLEYCKEIEVFKLSKAQIVTGVVKAICTGKSLQAGYFHNENAQDLLGDFISRSKPDHIYCQLTRSGQYAASLDFPKTIDLMDAYSYGMKKRARQSPWYSKWIFYRESKKIKAIEKNMADSFDNLTVISSQDKERLNLSTVVSVINNGVDVSHFKMDQINPSFDLVFVGNLGYHPNIIAVKKIVKDIIPNYQKQYNQLLSCYIAGARPASNILNLKSKNVEIEGWVEDIRTAYAKGKIMLAPIVGGMGQQNKILEAMSLGIPCIVSEEVATALRAVHLEHLLIANNDHTYATLIHQLLNDHELHKTLAFNAKQFVSAHYDWEAVTMPLVELIKNT